jgi:stage V sporulation protein SpoVS
LLREKGTHPSDPIALAVALAAKLLERGAAEILAQAKA